MAAPIMIEGTWEEVTKHADQLRGKRLKVFVLPDDACESGVGATLTWIIREYRVGSNLGHIP